MKKQTNKKFNKIEKALFLYFLKKVKEDTGKKEVFLNLFNSGIVLNVGKVQERIIKIIEKSLKGTSDLKQV